MFNRRYKKSLKYTISEIGIFTSLLKNHTPHIPEFKSFSGNSQIIFKIEKISQ